MRMKNKNSDYQKCIDKINKCDDLKDLKESYYYIIEFNKEYTDKEMFEILISLYLDKNDQLV